MRSIRSGDKPAFFAAFAIINPPLLRLRLPGGYNTGLGSPLHIYHKQHIPGLPQDLPSVLRPAMRFVVFLNMERIVKNPVDRFQVNAVFFNVYPWA
jgi:hypothetical protein